MLDGFEIFVFSIKEMLTTYHSESEGKSRLTKLVPIERRMEITCRLSKDNKSLTLEKRWSLQKVSHYL